MKEGRNLVQIGIITKQNLFQLRHLSPRRSCGRRLLSTVAVSQQIPFPCTPLRRMDGPNPDSGPNRCHAELGPSQRYNPKHTITRYFTTGTPAFTPLMGYFETASQAICWRSLFNSSAWGWARSSGGTGRPTGLRW